MLARLIPEVLWAHWECSVHVGQVLPHNSTFGRIHLEESYFDGEIPNLDCILTNVFHRFAQECICFRILLTLRHSDYEFLLKMRKHEITV